MLWAYNDAWQVEAKNAKDFTDDAMNRWSGV
jgi:hypothetical protein